MSLLKLLGGIQSDRRSAGQTRGGRVVEKKSGYWIVAMAGRSTYMTALSSASPAVGDIVQVENPTGRRPYISGVLGPGPRQNIKEVWIDG